MSEGSYHWTNYEHNEYETLFRPDGTEVTTITEPEDRNFYRDLAPVCIELNALQAENARLREAIGLATTAAPTMEMDAADPVGMMQRVVAEVTRLRAQADALATALRNQGLLQNTFHGTVWHIHDCPASFDFSECHYRCRVAREAFALAGMEPYVSPETRRDTEVYE